MAKKKNYYPLTICGTFLSLEFLETLKKEVLEEISESVTIQDFVMGMLKEADLTDASYLKSMIMVDVKNILIYGDEEPFEPGYFLGVDFLETPEQFSRKRIQIDVRNVLTKIGFIYEDESSDCVQVFNRVVVSGS